MLHCHVCCDLNICGVVVVFLFSTLKRFIYLFFLKIVTLLSVDFPRGKYSGVCICGGNDNADDVVVVWSAMAVERMDEGSDNVDGVWAVAW